MRQYPRGTKIFSIEFRHIKLTLLKIYNLFFNNINSIYKKRSRMSRNRFKNYRIIIYLSEKLRNNMVIEFRCLSWKKIL
jgi:hypothetical protein